MNSATKLIHITMAITCWQFSLVQAGPTLEELMHKDDATYQALEMNTDSKNIIFRSRDDQKQEGPLRDPTLKFLYFCPPQEGWHTKANEDTQKSCLFLVEISNERKTVRCKNQVVPSLSPSLKRNWGTNNQGVLHSLHHFLFYPTNEYFRTKKDWLSLDMKKYEDLANNRVHNIRLYVTTITIYRFCFYYDTHETAFARYTMRSLVSSKQTQQIPRNFDTQLPKKDDQLSFGLDDAPLCYKKKNQSFGADFGSNIDDDYLVEQMLVPWDDMVEDIQRGTIKNYVNISPQWKSLRDDWNNLNAYFKPLPTQLVICGTYGKFEHIRIGKTQVDEQQQQEIQIDQSHDSNTLGKPNLTLTVPLYWWKLILFSEDKGIVVIMPNYPKSVSSSSDTIKPLCEDVCDTYGWNDVKQINPTIVCCRPGAKLIAKLLSSSTVRIPKYLSALGTASNVGAKGWRVLWNSFKDVILCRRGMV